MPGEAPGGHVTLQHLLVRDRLNHIGATRPARSGRRAAGNALTDRRLPASSTTHSIGAERAFVSLPMRGNKRVVVAIGVSGGGQDSMSARSSSFEYRFGHPSRSRATEVYFDYPGSAGHPGRRIVFDVLSGRRAATRRHQQQLACASRPRGARAQTSLDHAGRVARPLVGFRLARRGMRRWSL
jgi:hypothetical protein